MFLQKKRFITGKVIRKSKVKKNGLKKTNSTEMEHDKCHPLLFAFGFSIISANRTKTSECLKKKKY